ncbi:MAG TPA: molybdopterin cofactor-binding domain-containing protein [Polyangiaceae bacterium]|nr:molybdopterin cofactor-binding domain-containing protein [Polyangiaceae bacterium]
MSGGAGEGLGRRALLRAGALAGGGLFLALASCKREAKPEGAGAEGAAAPAPAAATEAAREGVEVNAFVVVHPDNSATIRVAKSEMGQAVRTTLALMVAEELDLDWGRARVEQAPLDAKRFGDQGTGGSASVRGAWTTLREAGAKARALLVAAAAEKLGAPAEGLKTEASHVVDPASGRRVPYAELALLVGKQKAPASAPVKDPNDFKLLGREHANVDAPAIARGAARYGLDVRKPRMLFASIERAPVPGAKVASFRADAALAVRGVKKVVEVPAQGPDVNVPSGVAVVADSTWAAMQGRKKLAIEWAASPHASEASAPHLAEMERATSAAGRELVNRLGDPDGELAKARAVVRARYEVPFIAHATMEPMNFTAEVRGDKCLLTGPTQNPEWAAKSVAKALGLAPENVSVEVTLLGGGFGRRLNPDYVVEAALVAKQLDAPVQVVWTREDDLRHDFYRPPALHVIEASLDAKGYPHAWRHRLSTAAISATIDPEAKEFGLQESTGASTMLYRVPHRSCEYTHAPIGTKRGWWRGVHTTHTVFAVESFLDELAEKAGKDPYEYRLALIDELKVDRPKPNKDFPWSPDRLKAVLKTAAEKAGWGKALPPGRGAGIACGIDHLSYAAQVVEVSTAGGALRVDRVVCAVDCGRVLNPNGARAQIEGGIVQALSAALKEKISVNGGRVEQSNFDDYPVARINEAPAVIEVHFVNTDLRPSGLGEPSVPPLAPALANAIYRATGKRHRSLPIAARPA